MKEYKNILLCIELNHKTDNDLMKQAKVFADKVNAEITLIHVVEFLSGYGPYALGTGLRPEENLLKNAKQEVELIANQLNIPQERQIVRIGSAKFIIVEEAKRIGADLIILGSHGRHGIRAILGSTANAVLHSAIMDVMTIRLKE